MGQLPFNKDSLHTIGLNKHSENRPVSLRSRTLELSVYPQSIIIGSEDTVFIGRYGGNRFLGVLSNGQSDLAKDSKGTFLDGFGDTTDLLKVCSLSRENASIIRSLFEFTRPNLVGIKNSFGFGDRLGIAGPAHLRAVKGTDFTPIMAQQSIRELDRTEREAHEVMDSATWAVLQEGYRGIWGADGDHLKSPEDIDRVLAEGFTMITVDPGEYVDDKADRYSLQELKLHAKSLPWGELETSLEDCLNRYRNQTFRLTHETELTPSIEDTYRAICKYSRVVAHTKKMLIYLEENHRGQKVETELSIDETDSVTSPFEHLFLANELRRLGINIISLAPRFIGRFEKGIDYIGDLEEFNRSYQTHVAIANNFGPYKIGLHSGSDKFSVYREMAKNTDGRVHIKTAGTSYLEALKTIAATSQPLFREIFQYSMDNYSSAKATYHVSARTSRVPGIEAMTTEQMVGLIENNDDLRQILHVNFGGVLTLRNESGGYLYRDQLLCHLDQHETIHFKNLETHLKRHLDPFQS